MSTPIGPRREQPGTYVVHDSSGDEELARLQLQDHMTTTAMGGVLPEQQDTAASLQRVLDVGCGTGDWLIEAAKAYPNMSLLIGVDVNRKFIEYARKQAEASGVSERVEFHVTDALRMLEFPASFFDLVNQRGAMSWLRTWDWSKLLQEYQRVTRPGGVIRVGEVNAITESTSPALTHLFELFMQAFYQSGHLFTPTSDGVTSELARLLERHGVQHVQTCPYALEYRGGTPEGQSFAEDMRVAFRVLLPFLRKWIHLPDDYEATYQQALREMQQPDFVATMHLLIAWGTTPE